MFETIKQIIFGKTRQYESILITNDGVILNSATCPNTYTFNDFTGHIKFKDTNCYVENAGFELVIRRPEYLDKDAVVSPSWNEDINYMIWNDGIVKNGNLTCKDWNGGQFFGTDLIIRDEFKNGIFKGRKLVTHVIKNIIVESGAVNCNIWADGTFKKGTIVCNIWQYGTFEDGIFIEGSWLNGYFNGGTFKGNWNGGVFNNGVRM